MRRSAIWLLLSIPACPAEKPGGASIGEPEATQLPAVKVDLPPPPVFVESKIPETYPDQTLSVHGVRKSASRYLDQEVRIKAQVLDVYKCPCPGGKVSDTCGCDQPHFWVVDEPSTPKEKAMLVADMPYDDRTGKDKDLKIKPGDTLILTGTFARQSNTGFASSEGLLIYRAHARPGAN